MSFFFQVLQHLNTVNFTTTQGELFYFEGADVPAKYDLVNWQMTPEGELKLVRIGLVDGYDLKLDETAIQWRTGFRQVIQTLLDGNVFLTHTCCHSKQYYITARHFPVNELKTHLLTLSEPKVQ